MDKTQIEEIQSAVEERQKANVNAIRRYSWVTLVIVAMTQGSGILLQSMVVPSTARPMRHALSELPRKIGHWTGNDAEVDPRTIKAVGSDDQVSRSYVDGSGDTILVHCATWMSTNPGMPHGPEQCYTTSGWDLRESRTVTLPGRPNVRVAVQKYQQSGQRLLLVWWYQMDDRVFIDWNGGRAVHREYWGRHEWSPLTKALLQTDDADQAEAKLLEIATRIYDFNREL